MASAPPETTEAVPVTAEVTADAVPVTADDTAEVRASAPPVTTEAVPVTAPDTAEVRVSAPVIIKPLGDMPPSAEERRRLELDDGSHPDLEDMEHLEDLDPRKEPKQERRGLLIDDSAPSWEHSDSCNETLGAV